VPASASVWPADVIRAGDLTFVGLKALIDLAGCEPVEEIARLLAAQAGTVLLVATSPCSAGTRLAAWADGGVEAALAGRRPEVSISEFAHLRFWVANVHHAGFTQPELRLLEKVSAILDEPRR